jgi:hypothetical protein
MIECYQIYNYNCWMLDVTYLSLAIGQFFRETGSQVTFLEDDVLPFFLS